MPFLPGGDSDLQRAIFQALQAGISAWSAPTASIVSSPGRGRSGSGNPVCDLPSRRPASLPRVADHW